MADLPVTMNGLEPLITAKINGEEARFVADSGAFFSMISDTGAAKYGLKLTEAPFGFFVVGIGGRENAMVATVKEFTFAGVPFHNVEFLVAGSIGDHPEYVGLLGQNFFRLGDAEYDLANGSIRLMRAEGCEHAVLAYWLTPSEPFSVMDIQSATATTPHTTGSAQINGVKIRVVFDTGSPVSMVSMQAAARAGIKPDSDGVVDGGYSAGLGPNKVKTYIGRFASFKVGDEEIKNATLRFGQINADVADMLIGADFFLSHHVYVASSQRKLYFTYNGGPVFNLTATGDHASIQAPPGAAAETPQAAITK
jgi:predicted aspartyl protease